MPAITVYCVETFWRNKTRMEKGQLRQYGRRDEAIAAGRALSSRVPGVLVYQVTGSPSVDHWDEPELIAQHGDVPSRTH